MTLKGHLEYAKDCASPPMLSIYIPLPIVYPIGHIPSSNTHNMLGQIVCTLLAQLSEASVGFNGDRCGGRLLSLLIFRNTRYSSEKINWDGADALRGDDVFVRLNNKFPSPFHLEGNHNDSCWSQCELTDKVKENINVWEHVIFMFK